MNRVTRPAETKDPGLTNSRLRRVACQMDGRIRPESPECTHDVQPAWGVLRRYRREGVDPGEACGGPDVAGP